MSNGFVGDGRGPGPRCDDIGWVVLYGKTSNGTAMDFEERPCLIVPHRANYN